MIGLGYYGTFTPGGDPAQRAGEPGLVHGVHAVSAGDQPGPAGGAAELPDHGDRSDRADHGERVDAGRGHGGGRGDDAGAAGVQGQVRRCTWWTRTRCRRRWPCCGPGPSRWASSSRWSTWTPVTRCRTEFFGLHLQYPGASGAVRDHAALVDGRARERCAGDGGGRSAGADAAAGAGGDRRGHRGRHDAAVRRAAGLRWPARRLPGGARRAGAVAAGPAGRGVEGRGRRAGVPAGVADPGAAHPPGEGDQQHLHGAGAAGGDGEHVRGVSRSGRVAGDRASGSTSARWPSRAGWPRRVSRWRTRRSSTR